MNWDQHVKRIKDEHARREIFKVLATAMEAMTADELVKYREVVERMIPRRRELENDLYVAAVTGAVAGRAILRSE